ncbi:MAG: hypothetical protein ACKOS8_11130 [Gemmataceae bacterium]
MRHRAFWVALVLGCLGLHSLFGQDAGAPDPLKEAQARLAVSIGRVESQYRDQLRIYEESVRKDPEKARMALDAAERMVQGEPALPEKRKSAMLDQIQKRRVKATGTAVPSGEDLVGLARTKPAKSAPSELEKQQAETSNQLKEISRLGESGKTAESNRKLAELSRKDGANPAVVAANQLAGTRSAIKTGREVQTRMNQSMVAAFREIEAAGVPIVGDMVFPDDWAEKTKRRSANARMSEKERAIIKALGSSMSMTMEGEQLKYFLDAMEKQLGIPLVIDKQALETAGIGMDTPISIRAKNWSARSVLRKVFSDLGIAYIIRSEEVMVTTQETARETMITRSYYIGDLLPIFGNNNMAGLNNPYMDPFTRMNLAAASQVQFAQTLTGIIDSIKSQVDPNSWAPNGQGSIVFEPLSMSLIVKQTAEVHFMLGSTLR